MKSGRAGAFLGVPGPVLVTGLVRLVSAMAEVFSGYPDPPVTIGELCERIDRRVRDRPHPELTTTWAEFQLLGSREQAI